MDYAAARDRALAAGDEEAVAYFNSKIAGTTASGVPNEFAHAPQTVPQGAGKPIKPGSDLNFVGSVMQGAAQGFGKIPYALKEALVGLSPEQRDFVNHNKEITRNAGGGAVLGEMGADIATSAVPMSKLTKAISALRIPAAASTAGKLGAMGATAAAQSVLTDPTGVEGGQGDVWAQKGENAGKAALWSMLLGGAGRGMARVAAQPFKPTPQAEALIKEGITPTLQQGAAGHVGRWIGGLTSGAFPTKERQSAELLRAYNRRLQPGLDTTGMTPTEFMPIMERLFKGQGGEYNRIYGNKTFYMTDPMRARITAIADSIPDPRVKSEVQGVVQNMLEQHQGRTRLPWSSADGKSGLHPQYLKYLENQIENFNQRGSPGQANATKQLQEMVDFIKANVVDPRLSMAERDTLRNSLDPRYAEFQRLVEAGGASPLSNARITINQLADAFRKQNKETYLTHPKDVQNDLLNPAMQTMGLHQSQNQQRALAVAALRATAGMGKVALPIVAYGASPASAWLSAPLYAASLAGQTKKGAEFMFGKTRANEILAEKLRQAALAAPGMGTHLGENDVP